MLWYHLADLIRPYTLFRHHLADFVAACLYPTLWHHLANLIRPYTLFRHHLADFV